MKTSRTRRSTRRLALRIGPRRIPHSGEAGALTPAGALLLTKAQMAGVLQVSVRCVSDMMKRGELPYLKLRGRFVRFRLEDVQRRLNETALVCNGGEDAGKRLKAEKEGA